MPLGIVLLWILVALLVPVLPLSPHAIDLPNVLASGSLDEWLGYDDLGRPILDRLVVGARTSLFVAVAVVGISLVVGSLVGTIGAYIGGWTDFLLVRLIDVFLPSRVILLAIGPGRRAGAGH